MFTMGAKWPPTHFVSPSRGPFAFLPPSDSPGLLTTGLALAGVAMSRSEPEAPTLRSPLYTDPAAQTSRGMTRISRELRLRG